MDWQYIAIAGFGALVIFFLVVLFVAQKVLRVRSERARARSMTDTGCG